MNDKIICKHCGAEIYHAIEKRTQEIFLTVFPEGKDNFSYQHDNDGDIISSVFTCPECAEEIAKNEKELFNLFKN